MKMEKSDVDVFTKIDEENSLPKNNGTEKQPKGEKRLEVSLVVDETDVCSDQRGHKDSSGEAVKPSKESEEIDEANLHYEDGICIYTEPKSKCQYVWNDEKQEWTPRNNESSFSDKDYDYDGNTYTYTDKETNVKYSWNSEKNEWEASENSLEEVPVQQEVMKDEEEDEEEEDDGNAKKTPKEITRQDMSKGHYGYENDTYIYTDPSDGAKYFWDKEKNAWFPKVDDDFLAKYQMSYGFIDPNEIKAESDVKKSEPPAPPDPNSLKRKALQEPVWFDVGEESTKVYVSGLPLDITETELVDVMQKCGLLMRDLDTGNMKIKIYLDPETSLPKGDALCTYIKKESVALALDLLDGSDVRGRRISVQKAKFTMKGDAYNPTLKPKKRKKKDKEKMKKIQEKLFDWRPDKFRGERSKHEAIVIIKNLFGPILFNKEVKLILEYQQDLREECLKCGSVKKVIIYDRHPEGVAQVSFKEVEAADACVQLLNGRWFGQRKITAETWDGKTRYKMSETDEQIKARLEKWEKFLESGETLLANERSEASGKERKSECKEESKSKNDESEVTLHSSNSEETKRESSEVAADSGEDTRSTVGSDYDTDEEVKKVNS